MRHLSYTNTHIQAAAATAAAAAAAAAEYHLRVCSCIAKVLQIKLWLK
jgi:hypothetical protein